MPATPHVDLGSDRTDEIVTFVRRAGPRLGIYGARVTGGGSGGAVAILARADASPLVQGIADRCARRWGSTVRVLSGTSSGAAACGVCALSV